MLKLDQFYIVGRKCVSAIYDSYIMHRIIGSPSAAGL
jgi:hypothetical protein